MITDREALRERVATNLRTELKNLVEDDCRANDLTWNELATLADAAIAIVMEEAARVADGYEGKGFELGLHTQSGDAYVTRSDIAAALRAYVTDPGTAS